MARLLFATLEQRTSKHNVLLPPAENAMQVGKVDVEPQWTLDFSSEDEKPGWMWLPVSMTEVGLMRTDAVSSSPLFLRLSRSLVAWFGTSPMLSLP